MLSFPNTQSVPDAAGDSFRRFCLSPVAFRLLLLTSLQSSVMMNLLQVVGAPCPFSRDPLSSQAELVAAVCDTAQGADLAVLQKLLEGAKELGRGKLPAEEAAAALEVASRLSKRSVVDLLLRWDAPVTEDAVRSADAHLPPPSASLTKTCSGLSKVGADEEQYPWGL